MAGVVFTCKVCGKAFSIAENVLQKYPNWKPQYCREHSPRRKENANQNGRAPNNTALDSEPILTLAEVRRRFHAGPQDGIFTDGGARPNPGPGGWGVVYVEGGQIVKQEYGHDPDTTNNRMELTALICAYRMAGDEQAIDIYSDSELCVNTITKWAPAWERRGWKRKDGPVKNLDLVKELYELHTARPRVNLRWIESHNGWLWNEYADSLASAWAREEL